MKRKEIIPNCWHRRVIDRARHHPVIQTNHPQFETKYTCGSDQLNPNVVAFCIRQGWLVPQHDGLFEGYSQTYIAA